jgi:hypothetical protein
VATARRLSAAVKQACAAELGSTATPYGSSRWAAWRSCAYKHHLRYREGIKPVDTVDYFSIGIALHAVLAYSARSIAHDWRDMVRYLDLHTPHAGEVAAEVERLCEAYFLRYGDKLAGWEDARSIGGVELKLQLWRPFAYSGRVDLLVTTASGPIIVDHKTRGRKIPNDSEEYQRDLATRPQLLGLSWLARRKLKLPYYPPVCLNEIIKTRVPDFARTTVRMDPERVEAWVRNEKLARRRMRLDRPKHGRHGDDSLVLRNYDCCAPTIGSRCVYFDWCHGTPRQRAIHYTQETQHDEQAENKAKRSKAKR